MTRGTPGLSSSSAKSSAWIVWRRSHAGKMKYASLAEAAANAARVLHETDDPMYGYACTWTNKSPRQGGSESAAEHWHLGHPRGDGMRLKQFYKGVQVVASADELAILTEAVELLRAQVRAEWDGAILMPDNLDRCIELSNQHAEIARVLDALKETPE